MSLSHWVVPIWIQINHIFRFLLLLLLDYIYCILNVYKAGICWCFKSLLLLHELSRLVLQGNMAWCKVLVKRSGTSLLLYVCQDVIEKERERCRQEVCVCVWPLRVCCGKMWVHLSYIWYTHNTRHSQHHTAHVYLIRQEAAPVTFSCLFMMCRVQCRGQRADEVEAPHFRF